MHFNPRSPHGERQRWQRGRWHSCYFNPRSPHGERLRRVRLPCAGRAYFNPRSPHGERHGVLGYSPIAFEFQSTLPARGATAASTVSTSVTRTFQSTLPARGATGGIQHFVPAIAISIHAPRTGSDGRAGAYGADAADFNPRSPHGERRLLSYTHRKVTFQSTLPARGATRCTFPESRSPGISIHAPRTGSDPAASQSRQPPAISTHAPRTGSDGLRGQALT